MLQIMLPDQIQRFARIGHVGHERNTVDQTLLAGLHYGVIDIGGTPKIIGRNDYPAHFGRAWLKAIPKPVFCLWHAGRAAWLQQIFSKKRRVVVAALCRREVLG